MKRVTMCVVGLLVALASVASGEPEVSDETPATIVIQIGSDDPPSAAVQVYGDPLDVLEQAEAHDMFQASGFIDPDRAVELARDFGLKPGNEPWRAYLLFDAELGEPVWRVMNTMRAEPGRIEGRAINLHAMTGANLGASDWWVHID